MENKKAIRELYKLAQLDFGKELMDLETYKEVIERKRKNEELIKNCFKEDDLKIFQEYMNIQEELSAIEMEESFVKGYSLANKLFIDSLR